MPFPWNNDIIKSVRKNIDNYWDKYEESYGFEEVLRVYREKKAIDYLHQYGARNILEIGCGFRPLFSDYKEFERYTVVEPGQRAYQHVSQVSGQIQGVTCVYGHLEDVIPKLKKDRFDSIVLLGVLHEVKQPKSFLKIIYEIMEKGSTLYINVPNAKSMHRELGKCMGVIDNLYDKTERNLLLNQESIFDHESLIELVRLSMPMIEIIESGTFFIKPFTHDQMLESLKVRIITQQVIEGLSMLSNIFPDHGCELYCVIRK